MTTESFPCRACGAVGFRLSAALLRRARARLHPDDPGARPAAQQAAAFFREVGAVTMLRGLEPFLDDEAVASAAVGEATPAG